MNRRAFVASLGAVLGPPLAVDAQQSAAIPRIGYLTPSSRGLAVPPASNAFRDGLREHGYIDGAHAEKVVMGQIGARGRSR